MYIDNVILFQLKSSWAENKRIRNWCLVLNNKHIYFQSFINNSCELDLGGGREVKFRTPFFAFPILEGQALVRMG